VNKFQFQKRGGVEDGLHEIVTHHRKVRPHALSFYPQGELNSEHGLRELEVHIRNVRLFRGEHRRLHDARHRHRPQVNQTPSVVHQPIFFFSHSWRDSSHREKLGLSVSPTFTLILGWRSWTSRASRAREDRGNGRAVRRGDHRDSVQGSGDTDPLEIAASHTHRHLCSRGLGERLHPRGCQLHLLGRVVQSCRCPTFPSHEAILISSTQKNPP
jgi:hypothetical protein